MIATSPSSATCIAPSGTGSKLRVKDRLERARTWPSRSNTIASVRPRNAAWVEASRVERQLHRVAVEVIGHRQRVGANRLLVLVQIGFGDGERIRDRGANPVAEPRLHAIAEEQV